MDSTIVTGETLDELADFAGLKERIAAITARAMNGELDFKAALRERVAMLKGLPVAALQQTWQRVRLTPGAQRAGGDDARARCDDRAGLRRVQLLHQPRGGAGGFRPAPLERAAGRRCGADRARWRSRSSIATPRWQRYARLARGARTARCTPTLAVGDGANDLDMLREAGLGVAFHAKPIVAAAAQARVDHADLRALLFAQGYRAREFVTA